MAGHARRGKRAGLVFQPDAPQGLAEIVVDDFTSRVRAAALALRFAREFLQPPGFDRGDHLGHRHPDTTRLYAKVDLNGLRQVADFNLGELL